MANISKKSVEALKAEILRAIEKAKAEGKLADAEVPDFVIEIPADRKNGDLATNVAMVCARVSSDLLHSL